MVAGFLYLYFQCNEMEGAKWQVSAEMFQSQFQIGILGVRVVDQSESIISGLPTIRSESTI
jgi:hypothetical protein